MNNQWGSRRREPDFRHMTLAYISYLIVFFIGLSQVDLMAQEMLSAPTPELGRSTTVVQESHVGVEAARKSWGSTMLGFRVGLVAEKTSYLTGERVCVTICVSNTTHVALYEALARYWPIDYDFIIKDDHGQTIGLTKDGEQLKKSIEESGRRDYTGFYLNPSEVFEKNSCISELYNLSMPGEYEITAIQQILDSREQNGFKMIPVRSGSIHIQIGLSK